VNKISYFRKRIISQYNNGELEAAIETGEALLREQQRNLQFATMGYATDMYNLARIHDEMGELERAKDLYNESARHMYTLEGETVSFANCLGNFAMVLSRTGHEKTAYVLFWQVSNIYRNLGQRNSQYADSLYNLANISAILGKHKESLKYHLDALQIRQREGLNEDIINSLHSIAFLYETTNEYNKAVAYAEMAVKFASHNLSHDAETYISACTYLAGLYESNSKYAEAIEFYDKVLETMLNNVGISKKHSAYLNMAFRRASALSETTQLKESLECFKDICEIFEKISDKYHTFYASCLRNIANLHADLNEPSLAESKMLECMKICRAISLDITSEVLFLLKLYLNDNIFDISKALEILVYSLMCCNESDENLKPLINNIVEVFEQENTFSMKELLAILDLLCDRDKLSLIISKWKDWEMVK